MCLRKSRTHTLKSDAEIKNDVRDERKNAIENTMLTIKIGSSEDLYWDPIPIKKQTIYFTGLQRAFGTFVNSMPLYCHSVQSHCLF